LLPKRVIILVPGAKSMTFSGHCRKPPGVDESVLCMHGTRPLRYPDRAGVVILVKAIAGLIAGVILAVVLFIGISFPSPMTADEAVAPEGFSDNMTSAFQSITQVLNAAVDEFQDEDLAQYYVKLINSYELDEASSWLAPDDGSDDPEVIPDIERINRMAITLPLLEVRNNIQDEDIAKFYDDFLIRAGWIEPN